MREGEGRGGKERRRKTFRFEWGMYSSIVYILSHAALLSRIVDRRVSAWVGRYCRWVMVSK